MEKSIDALLNEYASIRAGRANPHVLDKIKVDYYGTPTPIQAGRKYLRSGGKNDSDPAVGEESDPPDREGDPDLELGINPSNDGSVIRLVFPELTEERRKELAKDVKKKGDGAKVAIRNIRRDANEAFKKMEKSDEISEDDLKELTEKVQKLTDKSIEKIDKAVENKTKEILTV